MFNINPSNKLEREFEIAKDQGRWLSDEEWKDLEQREAIRSKLIVLAGICALLPPLWPFALGLNIYLLFPKNNHPDWSRRNCFFLLSSLLLTSALILLLWDLINAFF